MYRSSYRWGGCRAAEWRGQPSWLPPLASRWPLRARSRRPRPGGQGVPRGCRGRGGPRALSGLRAGPLALWLLLRHQDEGLQRLSARLRARGWGELVCAAGCHFSDGKSGSQTRALERGIAGTGAQWRGHVRAHHGGERGSKPAASSWRRNSSRGGCPRSSWRFNAEREHGEHEDGAVRGHRLDALRRHRYHLTAEQRRLSVRQDGSRAVRAAVLGVRDSYRGRAASSS